MEVTSTGEAKPLAKKVCSSSNSLNKSSVSLSKFPADDPAQGLDYPRQYNPYDNTPEIPRTAKVGKKGRGEKWRESSASACCHSEFVDFIDNMEERAGSLKSVNR